MALSSNEVLAGLEAVSSPDGVPLPKTGVLSDILVADGKVFFSITVNAAVVQAWEPVRQRAEAAVKAIPGVVSVMVALTAERKAGAAVAAAVAAAASARRPGRRAGAEPDGHCRRRGDHRGRLRQGRRRQVDHRRQSRPRPARSRPQGRAPRCRHLRTVDAEASRPQGKAADAAATLLMPMDGHGLKVMSIGFLVEEETPMIWRGPMVMSALTQMLREVEWGTLDIMVVDMPPGTGDAQLTMAQQVPLKGAVIVSTPQDLALIDARRGIAMFNRVNVPVLGIVENMSYFLCPHCGTRSDIFSHGGARHEAERLGVPFLGEVPLHMEIRERSDAGLPVVTTVPDGPHARIYRDIAARVRDQLAGRSGKAAPKIVIEA